MLQGREGPITINNGSSTNSCHHGGQFNCTELQGEDLQRNGVSNRSAVITWLSHAAPTFFGGRVGESRDEI